MDARKHIEQSAPSSQHNPCRRNVLLLQEPPLQVLPSLATAIGLNEAIVLQQVYWLFIDERNGKWFGGHRWIFNTYEQWRKFFPFWSEVTIKRIFAQLETMMILESCQPEGSLSRRKWYRINEGMLLKLTNERLSESSHRINLIRSNRSKRSVPITENTETEKTLTKESKETSEVSDAISSFEDHPAMWIKNPIRNLPKEEQLRKIRCPKHIPSEAEFDDFLTFECLDSIAARRTSLYETLAKHKFHHWDGKRWRKIHDWQAYVRALDEKINGH